MAISTLKNGAKTLKRKLHIPEDEAHYSNDVEVASQKVHDAPVVHSGEYIKEKAEKSVHEAPKDNTVALTEKFENDPTASPGNCQDEKISSAEHPPPMVQEFI